MVLHPQLMVNGSGTTVPDRANYDEIADEGAALIQTANEAGSPLSWWVGLVLLLVLLRIAGESPAIPGVPQNIKVNAYNIATIGISAVIFIVIAKALTRRFPVVGLTPMIESV